MLSLQQVGQPRDVGGDPACLIACQGVLDVAPALRAIIVDASKRLTVGVADDEAFRAFIDGQRRREAASRFGHCIDLYISAIAASTFLT